MAGLKREAAERCSNRPHQYVLWRSRLDQHAGAMLNSPSDDHLLSNALPFLANFPDDGVLRISSKVKQEGNWIRSASQ